MEEALVSLVLLLTKVDKVQTSYFRHIDAATCVAKGQDWVKNRIGEYDVLEATFWCAPEAQPKEKK